MRSKNVFLGRILKFLDLFDCLTLVRWVVISHVIYLINYKKVDEMLDERPKLSKNTEFLKIILDLINAKRASIKVPENLGH